MFGGTGTVDMFWGTNSFIAGGFGNPAAAGIEGNVFAPPKPFTPIRSCWDKGCCITTGIAGVKATDRTEWTIGSEEHLVCDTLDCIAYNKEVGTFSLYDGKQSIPQSGQKQSHQNRHGSGPLTIFKNSKLNQYSY